MTTSLHPYMNEKQFDPAKLQRKNAQPHSLSQEARILNGANGAHWETTAYHAPLKRRVLAIREGRATPNYMSPLNNQPGGGGGGGPELYGLDELSQIHFYF